MNRLALLIPARNAEAVLPRLFESARQGAPFDEVLVFDDASTDNTSGVARRYGARVVRSDINVGPAFGKNELVQQTTCEWVHFHDADDELAPGFVDRAKRWMDAAACDVVLFGTEDRDDATGRSLGRTGWDDAALAADPVRYNITHTVTNCGVYRRTAFIRAGGFETDPATQYNEDQAMHLRLALAGLQFRAEPHVGVVINRRMGSMSSGRPIECARAQAEVLARVAAATGTRYRDELGARLWRLAGVCGGFKDWTSVDRCIEIASSVGYGNPRDEHWLVRAMAAFDPATAVRARELFIRAVKPSLRAGQPVAAAQTAETAR